MRKLILFLVFACTGIISQNLHQRFEGIPFNISGNSPINPFNGGIEIPRYQFTDIDGDGDLDLFMYDKDTTLNFYRNEGNASNPLFRLNTTRYQNLNIRNWFSFVDIDADNDKDLFCGGDSQHVRYYKNIGTTTTPAFQLQTYGVRTNLNNFMDSESACVPTFADMDADGKIDFFAGTSSGKVTYYQNTGTSSNFVFTFITDFYKSIEIIGGAADPRHGASSIMFADIDGDSDKDLFWGDLFGLSVYYIKNIGTAQNFNWNVVDTNSPEPNPYFSGGYNMPGIYDIDSDGRNDFFIGVLIGSKTINNFVYYRNNGPLISPLFTKITDNFILSADNGSYSYPCLADIDNDGDKDMFIGCDRSVAFFRNTGSATSPSFDRVTDSLPLAISNFNYSAACGDLDGDGKKDLVIGYYASARLKFFKNTGTLVNPAFTLQSSQLDTMNLVQASAPVLADVDSDGDLDILAGNSSGRITFYKNIGTAAAFNFQFISNNYMSITVGNDAAPSLGDLDSDGDLDLLVGSRTGLVYFYRNIGTSTIPNFTLVTNNYAGINTFQNAVPCIVDINNDTDPDLLLGNTKGGLYYYENWDVFGIQQIGSEIPISYSLYQNYPNPFNPTTKIRFAIPPVEMNHPVVSLKIYNILGKELVTLINGQLTPGTYEVDFDGNNYSTGVYYYRLEIKDSEKISGPGFTETRKMVLVK